MLRIGLTGGIGSGKSSVASALAAHGAVIVDADRLARQVIAPGSPGLARVVQIFGPDILNVTGDLDRRALAAVVFADRARLADLEAITHPLIASAADADLAAVPPERIAVYDMPLLVEKNLWPAFHLCVVVDAPVPVRLQRLVGRGMDEADARRRIQTQASDDERRRAADLWVDNSERPAALLAQVELAWGRRLAPFDENLRRAIPSDLGDAGGPVDHAALTRAITRVRYALGDRAVSVSADAVIRVEVGRSTSMPDVVAALARAGCAPLPRAAAQEHLFGSCDPASSVQVLVDRVIS